MVRPENQLIQLRGEADPVGEPGRRGRSSARSGPRRASPRIAPKGIARGVSPGAPAQLPRPTARLGSPAQPSYRDQPPISGTRPATSRLPEPEARPAPQTENPTENPV
ncbi:hypothetical protein GCM10027360_10880 [Amycolatopsis echigonensis]